MKKFKKLLYIFVILLLLLASSKPNDANTPNSDTDTHEQKDNVTTNSEFKVRYIDVGQADAALISCDGKHMLVDGGNRGDSDIIHTVLKNENISYLDYVVCTHAHEDHVGGLPAALNFSDVGAVYCSVDSYDSDVFRTFVEYTEKQELAVEIPEIGHTVQLGSADVVFIGPADDFEDTNNQSLIIKVLYGNTSFLFTGDAELDSETALLDRNTDVSCDVLNVAHHGSSTSSGYRFLYEADPEYAVISVGKDNSYGHPHEEVLSRLEDADITVYRTDIYGDIIAYSDGENISFEFGKNPNGNS